MRRTVEESTSATIVTVSPIGKPPWMAAARQARRCSTDAVWCCGRPGSVTRQQIEAVIGPLAEAHADAKRSPGRLARHYSPKAPVRLNADAPQPGEAYLAFGPGEHRWNLSPTGDLREAAVRLFAYLRDADRTDPAAIAVAPIPHEGLGEAINDRLKRAAGFVG